MGTRYSQKNNTCEKNKEANCIVSFHVYGSASYYHRPTKIEGQRIEGEGWVMELKDQYAIQKDKSLNNYKLIKKQ